MMNKLMMRANSLTSSVSRRGILRGGLLGAGSLLTGLVDPASAASRGTGERGGSVILLMMVGGPSQLETFDPKPDAPSGIQGPFGSIPTRIPGVRVCEHLPEIARRMDRLTLVRTLHHDEAPIHETGLQLIQTGQVSRYESDAPHFGAVAARLLGACGEADPFVLLPQAIRPLGSSLSRGQSAGSLGERFSPVVLDRMADEATAHYGKSSLGRLCHQAKTLVEAGSRVVVVNMATGLYDGPTWDAHGARPFSTFDDYRRTLLPAFDRAFSALVDDLDRSGLLDSTLVVATGECGRTPKINANGGRDHWTSAWSALLAGGGMKRGQVIGSTDRIGAEPKDQPVTPSDLLATIYRKLGIDPNRSIELADGISHRLVPAIGREPIALC